MEVYPRPDGSIYLCGIGGSDYIAKEDLKDGAFRENCSAKEDRVEAAVQSFQEMSKRYKSSGELEKTQACMRPCPPDAVSVNLKTNITIPNESIFLLCSLQMPYMGSVPGYEGAFINAGHNCW